MTLVRDIEKKLNKRLEDKFNLESSNLRDELTEIHSKQFKDLVTLIQANQPLSELQLDAIKNSVIQN